MIIKITIDLDNLDMRAKASLLNVLYRIEDQEYYQNHSVSSAIDKLQDILWGGINNETINN